MTDWLTLLVLYQVKHFLCDFPLQTPYMLGKFKETGWVRPLAAHCAVHASFTLAIVTWWGWTWLSLVGAVVLAAADFLAHFAMDRIKASPFMLGRFKPLTKLDFESHENQMGTWRKQGNLLYLEEERVWFEERKRDNTYFWWSLGLDQMVHHLTHYAIIAILILGRP